MKSLVCLLKIILLFLTIVVTYSCRDTRVQQTNTYNASFRNQKTDKADSLLATMTFEEKVGQLCILSNANLNHNQLENGTYLIKPGGILNTFSNPEALTQQFPTWDTLGTIPMFKANEAIQTFIRRVEFPNQLSLDAIREDSLIRVAADQQVIRLKTDSFHLDISTLLHYETVTTSTGEVLYDPDPDLRLSRSKYFSKKLFDSRILSGMHTLKHLPGSLPDTLNTTDSLNRYFREAALGGTQVLLVDPLVFENNPGFPVDSFENFLSKTISFDGLLVTKVPADKIESDTFFHQMFRAGIDLFILGNEPAKSYYAISGMINGQEEFKAMLDKKIQKILLAKSWSGLFDKSFQEKKPHQKPVYTKFEENWLSHALFEHSITLLRDSQKMLPLHNRDLNSIFLLSIGAKKPQDFINTSWKYASPASQHIETGNEGSIISLNERKLRRYGVVGIVLYDFQLDTILNSAFIEAYRKLNKSTKVAVINFGHPGNLRYFESSTAFIQIYETNSLLEDLAAQVLFGGVTAKGRSSVNVLPFCRSGDGIVTTDQVRLKYTIPQEVGIHPDYLKKIDSIALEAIYSGSAPGCQILLAKDGKVFYHRSFGYHTYSRRNRVRSSDLYDLASITKVAATTVSAMTLYDKGRYTINDSLYKYLPKPFETSIRNIRIRDLLIHQSGLQANMPVMPFLVYIDSTTGRYDSYYCWDDQQYFKVKVAEDFYMGDDYIDTMWTAVCQLPVDTSVGYQYSDVNFNIVQYLVEKLGEKPLNEYASKMLYDPLGLRKMTFNPLEKFTPDQIVPTEEDDYWRMQLVHGYVHDESAALHGGVAGNAGLFSNAHDLAVLFQMLLNKGQYGRERFLSEGTVDLFTRAVHGNHRGLGFDSHARKHATACADSASEEAYGHTGFTGTAVWADPKSGLLFIFLSNRVHPTRKNKGLYTRQIRERIHQAAYDALGSFELSKR